MSRTKNQTRDLELKQGLLRVAKEFDLGILKSKIKDLPTPFQPNECAILLIMCARENNSEMTKLVLSEKNNIVERSLHEQFAFRVSLDQAVIHGNIEYIAHIRQYPSLMERSDRGSHFVPLIVTASRCGNTNVVKFLLEYKEDRAYAGESLCAAVENGHIEIVHLLLSTFEIIPSHALIKSAIRRKHLDIVRILLNLSFPDGNLPNDLGREFAYHFGWKFMAKGDRLIADKGNSLKERRCQEKNDMLEIKISGINELKLRRPESPITISITV